MIRFAYSVAFAVFAFFSLSAEGCGPTHYISDSGFDLWCGDDLCNWERVRGSVVRASTWHEDDYAVELLGKEVEITQSSDREPTDCIRFEMLANIESGAQVVLSMDFLDDGVTDYEQELAHVTWEPLVYFVKTPREWQGVRFTIHKIGEGRARLAQIQATSSTECVGPPIELPEPDVSEASVGEDVVRLAQP